MWYATNTIKGGYLYHRKKQTMLVWFLLFLAEVFEEIRKS